MLDDEGVEAESELLLDLCLLRGREDVDDAMNRAGHVAGVQSREDEMAGFRGGQSDRKRLQVAHLADQDHIGILAQGSAERGGARRSVASPLDPPANSLVRFVILIDLVFAL